jgi:hypothetical protein
MHELIVWKETPYLECWLFVHGSNPHPCWSLAQSQLPHLRPPTSLLPSLPLPSSCQHKVYLHTNDISKPDSSSVGHT